MEGHNTYDHILKQKLNQLEAPAMDSMWEDMHGILDKKMPVRKKRRFIAWFFNRNMFVLLILSVTAGCVTWYSLSSPEQIQPTASVTSVKTDELTQKDVQSEIPENTGSKRTNGIAIKTTTDKKSLSGKLNLSINNIPPSIEGTQSNTNSNRKKLVVEKSRVKLIEQSLAWVKITAHEAISTIIDTEEKVPVANETNALNSQSTYLKKQNDPVSALPNDLVPFPANNNVQMRMVNVDPELLKLRTSSAKRQSYFVAGLAINYHVPVSGQEMSTIPVSGNNSLIDYLPSVYAQYHLNNKWFVQGELQYTSPQYIQPIKMESKYTSVNPHLKKEETVSLNKLYYFNLPVTIHYKPSPNLNVGAGIQYSYLRNSIIVSEICTWSESNSSWNKTYEKRSIHIKSNPGQEKRNNANNPASLTQIDTLAQGLRSNDWRIVVDLNYKWKNITGGARFNTGLNNYIDISSGGSTKSLRDRNEAFQLYLRYDLFFSDRKRKK